MRITIMTVGSQGDVYPCVALGAALQKAGYTIKLVAPSNFESFARGYGLDVYPLPVDFQKLLQGEEGVKLIQERRNIISGIRTARRMMEPVLQEMVSGLAASAADSDLILCHGLILMVGQSVSEIFGIPVLNITPSAIVPTRAFPHPVLAPMRTLGGPLNRFSAWGLEQILWFILGGAINTFRQSHNFKAQNITGYRRATRDLPVLVAMSEHVVPRPDDWGPNVHLTGYWLSEPPADWQPPAELVEFLENGLPPVYIGFGSMTEKDPETVTRMIFEALLNVGRRGLVLSGWAGIGEGWFAEQVYIADFVPYSWLFPRMGAIVHHGGAGTTAYGLRAGLPAFTVPFISDQFFWGWRVLDLGVGPAPVKRQALTTEILTQGIKTLLENESMQQRAATLGEKLRAEDGLARAVQLIERYASQAKPLQPARNLS